MLHSYSSTHKHISIIIVEAIFVKFHMSVSDTE